MEKPFIVGFSCYMWNIDYNLSLAKAIKAEWPDCVIALGGPQVPNDFEILEEYDFVDILMHGEGEVTFYELLKALAEDKKLKNVHNISYRDNGTLTRTEPLRLRRWKTSRAPIQRAYSTASSTIPPIKTFNLIPFLKRPADALTTPAFIVAGQE
ncbi:MAG: cobalamin-dependent protein [Clostridia bacterium]|nr:cobalamin-dependent protein [Clostridia bacterium]MBR2414065.1 cobalamin-dependent protein [Clostridia bacterium]